MLWILMPDLQMEKSVIQMTCHTESKSSESSGTAKAEKSGPEAEMDAFEAWPPGTDDGGVAADSHDGRGLGGNRRGAWTGGSRNRRWLAGRRGA